jgi:hypothetical protein
MADVTYIPDGMGQGNNLLPWLLAGNNGFGGLGGFNSIIDIFGLAIVAQMFGWNGNGFGGLGGNGAGMAGFISNQLNNNSGRELIMNAITSQGEASRAAVQSLSTMIGQDFNLVNAAVQSLQNGLSSLALQQAVSVPQLINAIQAGDSGLMAKLCECCCENRLLTTQQGYENRIQTIEQTNQLGSQADRNTAAITGSIADLKTTMVKEFCDARERDMQAKIDTQADIITQLRNQISNDKQTEMFTSAFNALNQKVTELAARQPNTVPVVWPNLAAVNTTPYVSGGYYQGGFNGFYGPGANGFNF